MKTHRCEKSLKAEVSIRYTKQCPLTGWDEDSSTWKLFHQISDADYDNIKCFVSEIEYCPYCGIKLKERDD